MTEVATIKENKEKILVKSTMSELLSHWRVQESLLQSYRRLFLTIEAILLSVGAISVTGSMNFWAGVVVLGSIGGIAFFTGKVFIPVIRRRGEAVFFWQAKILILEDGGSVYSPLREMKEFQSDPNHPLRQDPNYLKLAEREASDHNTREKLNGWFPFALIGAWIGIVVAFILSKAL